MDIRVAAYAVIADGDRMLLAHWNEGGRSGWTLPGGGIEPGEAPADAAVREVFEETGFTAQIDATLGVDSIVIPAVARFASGANAPLQAIRIVYRAHITGGSLTYELDGSTDYADWHRIDQIGALHRVSLVDAALRML
ncbi:NUDIX domain-containing protein [Paramicrobacterium humi]|uniref:NUDIX domain-containing protein n=1 Tax=Paramicrobacterium humi TaxID=640635 RepID=A0A1H4K7D6_9MICO|nr:NUDIX domain-containing protein [Microbacterium humi]SEB54333.1 NUDIX domain-containing protein [Microbacterium humi]